MRVHVILITSVVKPSSARTARVEYGAMQLELRYDGGGGGGGGGGGRTYRPDVYEHVL